MLSNLPTFVFANKQYSVYARRVLAFTLASDAPTQPLDNAKDFALSVVNTAVDGAETLQSALVPEVHEIRINTVTLRSTDFDRMTKEVVANLVKTGTQAAKEFFDNELSLLKHSTLGRAVCDSHDEVYAVLTEAMLNRNVKEVFVCLDTPDFVYSIFPTLFAWRAAGVPIDVFVRPPLNEHHAYQRRVLEALGANIHTVEELPFRGFLLDPTHHDNAQALIYLEDQPAGRILATHYSSREDRSAIFALHRLLPKPVSSNPLTDGPS